RSSCRAWGTASSAFVVRCKSEAREQVNSRPAGCACRFELPAGPRKTPPGGGAFLPSMRVGRSAAPGHSLDLLTHEPLHQVRQILVEPVLQHRAEHLFG